MIGFPALNYALYPMLKKPDTDSAVDIEYLLKCVRESWIDRKSSAHSKISSPCEMRKCNKKSGSSFENRSHPSIPWGKKSNTEKCWHSLRFYCIIILSIALNESIPQYGIYLIYNINQ